MQPISDISFKTTELQTIRFFVAFPDTSDPTIAYTLGLIQSIGWPLELHAFGQMDSAMTRN